MTSTCRACGARLEWGATFHGRRIPLQRRPDGNIVYRHVEGRGAAVLVTNPATYLAGESRFAAHPEATCQERDR